MRLVDRMHSTQNLLAGQKDVPLKVPVPNVLLEALSQLAVTHDHEPDVGDVAHDQQRGVDEMVVPLVR
jgi:hypothetical protein